MNKLLEKVINADTQEKISEIDSHLNEFVQKKKDEFSDNKKFMFSYVLGTEEKNMVYKLAHSLGMGTTLLEALWNAIFLGYGLAMSEQETNPSPDDKQV